MKKKSKYNTISDDDIFSLNLLNIQQIAVLIGFYSDILSNIAVFEGKELINNNYNGNEADIQVSPDETALNSLYAYLVAKLMFTQVGFTRYDHIYEKYINGDFPYSLEPNMDINIGNVLGLIGLLFLIRGAEGIYARDNVQPIFGVR